MKSTYRFFVSNVNFSQREIVVTDSQVLHQFTRVLRLMSEQTITLLDNTGFEYEIRILRISKSKLEGYVLNKKENEAEPKIQIHLYQSLLKAKDKFELVLQKGTEIGVTKFIPLRTERCEFKGKVNQARAYTILKEAAEQSGRGKIPDLFGERLLSDALQEAEGEKLLFDPLGSPLKTYQLSAPAYSLFIGPEGGFSEQEIKLAEHKGAKILSAGKQTLRSETAGIVMPMLVLEYVVTH